MLACQCASFEEARQRGCWMGGLGERWYKMCRLIREDVPLSVQQDYRLHWARERAEKERKAVCIHLGRAVRNEDRKPVMVNCPKCPESVGPLLLHHCGHPGHGQVTLADCKLCPDYLPRRPTPETPAETLAEQMDQWQAEELPKEYVRWPNYVEAFRLAMRRVAAAAQEAPPLSGRGVVIAAGGWRFFPSLYVTVRALRHVGCDWPVQVWYLGDLGEYDPLMGAALAPWGPLEWIDANDYGRSHGIRRRNLAGWELKVFAIRHSPFREILSLDADSYPAQNPARLFDHPEYQRTGAVFWPDLNPLKPGIYDWFGVPRHPRDIGGESGQLMIDKARHWPCVVLCDWMNDHSDYTYHHVYGDKDTFPLAWQCCGHEFSMPRDRPNFHVHSIVQVAWDGSPAFIHRTNDKFRVGEQAYNSGQVQGAPVPVRDMPGGMDALTFGWFDEMQALVWPEKRFAFRPESMDRDIWRCVTLHDEYRCPKLDASDHVLDVGAHIGAFAWLALRRGAGRVICVEADAENYQLLKANLQNDPAAILRFCAAWRSDAECPDMELVDSVDATNTGGKSLMGVRPEGGRSRPVPTFPFDELVEQATDRGAKRLRLLKIDCEGSEYPILYTSRLLDRVDAICGEYHNVTDPLPPHATVADAPPYTGEGLAGFLRDKGFAVEQIPDSERLGHFWARRE